MRLLLSLSRQRRLLGWFCLALCFVAWTVQIQLVQVHRVVPRFLAVPQSESCRTLRGGQTNCVSDNLLDPTRRSGRSDDSHSDAVLVVISSDRLHGILPTLASIVRTTTSAPVDVVMIGNHSINQQVRDHFGLRIHQFIDLTVDDVKLDLQRQGLRPIWTWDDWHSSIRQQTTWVNENTIRTDSWDNRSVHAHELNHLRFYLPYLSIFRNQDYLFFIDDDILVQTDLAQTARETLASLDDSKGFVTPCGIWKWRDECQKFHFSFSETMLDSSAVYGNQEVCKSSDQTNCVPESYATFLKSVLPQHASRNEFAAKELEWNFGFSLFALQNWRNLGLTDRYEAVMKENYRLHVYPETSLAFGLGVSFLAFVGAVECWNDDQFKV